MSSRVSLAAPQELLPALRLLFPQEVERARAAVAVAAAGRDPVGVFVARDGSGIRGAAMVQAIPGALGVAWAPVAHSNAEADELVSAACDWLRDRAVKVCQAFVAPEEAAAMAPLERHGFNRITQLVSMRCAAGAEELSGSLAFQPVEYPYPGSVCQLLLSTHLSSRDCPELDGNRTTEELVEGYGTSGKDSCNVALQDDIPCGVVLLSASELPTAIELAYMALTPAVRSRRLGHELIRFALSEAARLGAADLTLSVDARNEPALRLYHRAGFVETERREVFLADFSSR